MDSTVSIDGRTGSKSPTRPFSTSLIAGVLAKISVVCNMYDIIVHDIIGTM